MFNSHKKENRVNIKNKFFDKIKLFIGLFFLDVLLDMQSTNFNIEQNIY